MAKINKESELEILKKFQQKVSDVEEDESACLRFLIARDFDIPLAEAMLRHNVVWRREVCIENYLKWSMSDLRQDFEFAVTGTNNYGGPVVWCPIGRWAARYWIEKGKQEEVKNFSLYILETALVRMKELNNTPCTVILGMETLTYYKTVHKDTLKTLYTAFQTLETNYPEILQSLTVINAPWVFSIAFNFIKPILSPRTLAKLQVFGEDRDKWLPFLREKMPDEAIPSDYLQGSQ